MSAKTVRLAERAGRRRLSESFFLRDFLFSEIAMAFGLVNLPEDEEAAVWAGERLCNEILEPLQKQFGPIRVRSGYRSPAVNALGNREELGCASNSRNFGRHIWDRPDERGARGAMACIVVPGHLDHYEQNGDWQSLARWIHKHLPYSEMTFFPRLCAFNVGWSELPRRTVASFIAPQRGVVDFG